MNAYQKREVAARKYKPKRIRLLLVAEAPPDADDRYFYFDDVTSNDWLFVSVIGRIFDCKPDRGEKAKRLTKLKRAGIFLIDLKLDPVDGSGLKQLGLTVRALGARTNCPY